MFWTTREVKRDTEQECRCAGVSVTGHLRNELGGKNDTLETPD